MGDVKVRPRDGHRQAPHHDRQSRQVLLHVGTRPFAFARIALTSLRPESRVMVVPSFALASSFLCFHLILVTRSHMLSKEAHGHGPFLDHALSQQVDYWCPVASC
jgi:hypothetical protein